MTKQRKLLSKILASLLICIIIPISSVGYVIIHTDTCTGHNNQVALLHNGNNKNNVSTETTK